MEKFKKGLVKMIKCKDATCPNGKGSICYCDCNDDCEYRCGSTPNTCGKSIMEEPVETTNELTLFQNKAMAIMQEIAELDRQKKLLDVKDKAVRQELQEAMDKYGIKKFENYILKVTYVEPTTRTSIDSARLKKELPAIAEKYTKTSKVKGSVRIEVK
jgi:predicted phage-related endonuclease